MCRKRHRRPAPAGYAPFFINYIGRHGARHATGTTELQRLDSFLQEAADAGALLPDGQRLQGMIKILLQVENNYPAGRLTAIGEAEQFRIGQDMGQAYPDVVRQPGDCLQVMSTSEARTVQSAQQFLKGTRIPIQLYKPHA
jgi:multiple inositol-polyphosphate phosphatase/2,3-bisphosphoglycerate 3-phosphatase